MTETNKGQKDNLKGIARLKAQKLASVAYLISDFLNDSDSIKWRLREQSLVIMGTINPTNLEPSLENINQMIAYLDIVLTSSQISKMNISILRQEYQTLGELLLGEKGQSILEQLPSPTPYLKLTEEKINLPGLKTEIKRQIEHSKDNSRRTQIITYVKSHGESSIKDISRAVPHVSSKTVQRELSGLVRSGLLQREGDRRWSRYRVAI